MNPREQAVDTLLRINREGAFSNLETREVLSRIAFSDEDKGLYINLVYGTLQNQLYLDYILSQLSTQPLKKIHPVVLTILRTAAYQIYFLDRIPHYAIVDEAVTLTGRRQKRAKGFVNGVLRNLLRQKEELGTLSQEDFDNEKDYLTTRYSIPLWIVHKYFEAFGPEKAMTILPQMNDTPPFTIRTNTLKGSREDLIHALAEVGIRAEPGLYSPLALNLKGAEALGASLRKFPLFAKGSFTVQDQGAMICVDLLAPKPGEVVLDLCAAPGGKTTHMAQLMENSGQIIARDVYPSRLKLVEETARRLGITTITTEEADGTRLKEADLARFDRILLDAPCSGTGIIRRKPEIRYHGDKKERKSLRTIQKAMLDNAWAMLKPGGTLVYSTCAVNADENEGQIKALLQAHPDLHLLPETMGYTDLTMDGCDSFFHAKLVKEG